MPDDNKLPSCSIYSPYVAPGEGAPIGGIQKRIFDVVAASLIIIILLPIFGLIALAIKLCDGGDIFYGHRRIGHNGKPFFCFKFRTMVPDSDQRLAAYLQSDPVARAEWASCRKLRHDGRVTGIGSQHLPLR